jgi:hypothetical protein
VELLRDKGLDGDTLRAVKEQLFTERNEAELNAARRFYAGGEKITAEEFGDQLNDAKLRCSGVLAAATGLVDVCNDREMSSGVIQLIDDLLTHLDRLYCAFDAERLAAKMEAMGK